MANTYFDFGAVSNGTGANPWQSGFGPLGVCTDGTSIYAVSTTGNLLLQINIASKLVTGVCAVGTTPIGCAYDSSTGSVWVANNGANTVSKVRISDMTVTATVTVQTAPTGVTYSSTTSGNFVWVTNTTSGTVSKITASTATVSATITVGTQPNGLAWDNLSEAGGGAVWVANSGVAGAGTTATKILISTNGTTTVSGLNAGPFGVTADPNGTNVWVTNYGNAGAGTSINKIVQSTSVVSAITGLTAGPYGCTDDGTYVWIAHYNNNAGTTVTRLKISDSSTTSVTVGTGPSYVAYDSGSGTVWVANKASNSLTVITASSAAVLTTVSTSAGALNTIVAYTPTSGDVLWFRRSATKNTITVTFNFTVDTVSHIGWPISTDVDYATRPAAPTSGFTGLNWDNDSTSQIPTITSSTLSVAVTTGAGNVGQVFRRLTFEMTAATTVNFVTVNNSAEFRYCTILDASNTASAYALAVAAGAGMGATFYNCTITPSGTGGAWATIAASTKPRFYDCTFSRTGLKANTSTTSTSCSSGIFVRCSWTDAVATSLSPAITLAGATTDPVVFEDCTISLAGAGSSTTGTTKLLLISGSCVVRNCNYTGNGIDVTASPGATLDFSNFQQVRASLTSGINLTAIATIVASNVNFQATNGTNPTSDVATLFGASIQLNNPVFASPTQISGTANPGVISNDHEGVAGQWKVFGQRGTLQTSFASRSGGETFSIRASQEDMTFPQEIPLELTEPGCDVQFIALAQGTNTITLYGAHKNYGASPPTREDIWFDVEYLDQATGARRARSSTKLGAGSGTTSTALTSDSSTWSGDTGLTIFKIVLVVVAGQAFVAPLRAHFGKAGAGAYTLLDPKVVVS